MRGARFIEAKHRAVCRYCHLEFKAKTKESTVCYSDPCQRQKDRDRTRERYLRRKDMSRGVIEVDRCSMCGKLTAMVVVGRFLCPSCCELHGASFVWGAKTMERVLCYSRLTRLKVRRFLKSFWW